MKIVTFDAPIIISKLDSHNEIQDCIVNSIDQMGRFSYETKDGNQKISHTDWHLNRNIHREYWDIVGQQLINNVSFSGQTLGYQDHSLVNYWFQWYEKGDFHKFHIHPDCVFSSVYYLKLPNKSPTTTFISRGKSFSVNVSEGDVVTFPNFLCHESAPNNSNLPKIVIAFNSNFNRSNHE